MRSNIIACDQIGARRRWCMSPRNSWNSAEPTKTSVPSVFDVFAAGVETVFYQIRFLCANNGMTSDDGSIKKSQCWVRSQCVDEENPHFNCTVAVIANVIEAKCKLIFCNYESDFYRIELIHGGCGMCPLRKQINNARAHLIPKPVELVLACV